MDELFPFYRNETSLRLFKPGKESLEDYYIAKANGRKPHLMDGEHCRNTSREELEDECHALDTMFQIVCYIQEQNGHDDWE